MFRGTSCVIAEVTRKKNRTSANFARNAILLRKIAGILDTLDDIKCGIRSEILLVKISQGAYETRKTKKIESRLPLGSPYVSFRKSRAPSLSRPFCLVGIRSKNSGLLPYLAGSSGH